MFEHSIMIGSSARMVPGVTFHLTNRLPDVVPPLGCSRYAI